MKLAVLFPGQGSQFLGMGHEFIQADAGCREIMENAESICAAPLGKLCLEGPMEELTRAKYLQPAITAVNLMCWKMLKENIDGHLDVNFFAGHSLGEYSALCAAGVVSLEDTIRLVATRGTLMEREGQRNPGGMRAVIGLTIEKVEELIAHSLGEGIVTAANHNSPLQVVISGDVTGLDALSKKAEAAGAKVIPLNVSVANHSPLVADAVPDFAAYMAEISFTEPRIPILFNVTAGPEGDAGRIKEIMATQIASRVRWFETISRMLSAGVDTFIEAGPKPVLKGMMKKIVPKETSCNVFQFDTPDGLKTCLEKII